MKNLLLAFLAVAFVACSSATESEPDYPIRSGTWVIESPTDADWVGTSNQKAMATMADSTDPDTIHIEQPGDFDMEMWNDTLHKFRLKLYDGISRDSINPAKTTVKLPGVYPDSECDNGCFTGLYPTSGFVQFTFDYHCEDVKNNNIIFTFRRQDDTPYKVANFKTNGFKDAVETVAQCN